MSTESASTKAASAGDDEPVPKLPRGRGMKFSGPQIARIAMTLVTLVGVMLLSRPCANAVSNFVMSYEQGSGSAMPKPGNVDLPVGTGQYEQLRPGMSEAEIKAAMERARAKQHGVATEQGSAAQPGSSAQAGGATGPSSGSAAAPASGGAAAPASGGAAAPASGGAAAPGSGSAAAASGSAAAPASGGPATPDPAPPSTTTQPTTIP